VTADVTKEDEVRKNWSTPGGRKISGRSLDVARENKRRFSQATLSPSKGRHIGGKLQGRPRHESCRGIPGASKHEKLRVMEAKDSGSQIVKNSRRPNGHKGAAGRLEQLDSAAPQKFRRVWSGRPGPRR